MYLLMTDLTTKDSNGNDLEKGVFYEIITMGRSIPPRLHLFQGFKGNDYLFETHKGQKTFPIVTIDSLIRYSQEQLEDLVSDYKSLISFIKQHPQTSPKCIDEQRRKPSDIKMTHPEPPVQHGQL